MAYSTQGSTVVSVTNFGVKPDGVTNNRNAVQSAVDSITNLGGGVLHFPRGTCYWSGVVNVTGRNIGFVGDNDSVLIAAPNEASQKLNLSGARNIYFNNLTIDAGRTGGTNATSNQLGFISTINAENISVSNCRLYNSLNSLIYLGGGTRFVNISDNYFTGHFCGVYSYINPGEAESEMFSIQNNRFGNSWCSGSVAESACIKLQTSPSQLQRTRGHIISNNVIDSPMQMGVELWSNGRDNVVANNTIQGTVWGVSLDGQQNATVVGNTIKQVSYAGIELATLCKNNTVVGNTIDGFVTNTGGDVSRSLQYGIILSNVQLENNIVNGNTIAGASYGVFVQNALNTTLSSNIIRDCGISLNFQNASLVKAHDNLFATGVFGTNYHVFFDASLVPLTGFHFSDNKFRGGTTQQSIFYYNNGTSNRVYDVCFENNVTDNTTLGGYGIFIGGQLTPTNYFYRNNFGPSGANGSNSIQNASDTALPYQSTAIQNGYQFYGTSTITIPNSGIPYSSGAWINIASGDMGGNTKEQRFIVKYNGLGPPYTYDNRNENLEFYTAVTPYGLGSNSITVAPQGNYNGDIVQNIYVDNPDSAGLATVWINIRTGSAATSGYQMTVYGSDSLLISNPVVQFARPSFTANAASINLDAYGKNVTKTTLGHQMGNATVIYSPSSGIMRLDASGIGINYGTPQAKLSFGQTIANTTIALYDDLVGPTIYGLGIAPYTMRFHVDQPFSRFSFFDAPTGNEIFTIKASGYVGIKKTNPTMSLDVVGPLGVVTNSPLWTTTDVAVFENSGNSAINLLSPHGYSQAYYFSNPSTRSVAALEYQHALQLFNIKNRSGVAALSIDRRGFMGVGTEAPGFNLHVSGSVGFSGIATTTTANAGAATLPANPVGFFTINITGTDFKVPYYNV